LSKVAPRIAALLGAAAVVVLVARALQPAAPDGAQAPDAEPEPAAASAAPAGSGAAPSRDTAPDDPLHASDALRAPDPEVAWRRSAARAVRDVTQEKLGRTLDAADERRLVDAMAGVRWAAREGERETVDPDDPVSLARERERNETILASDSTFRDVTGIGVAEFLRLLDPEQIEDLAPSPTPAS
jgi:hypothetical protein